MTGRILATDTAANTKGTRGHGEIHACTLALAVPSICRNTEYITVILGFIVQAGLAATHFSFSADVGGLLQRPVFSTRVGIASVGWSTVPLTPFDKLRVSGGLVPAHGEPVEPLERCRGQ